MKEKPYLCEYEHDGAKWSVEIYAKSFEDANQRLRAIAMGNVLGEVKLTVPVVPGWAIALKRWIAQKANPKPVELVIGKAPMDVLLKESQRRMKELNWPSSKEEAEQLIQDDCNT